MKKITIMAVLLGVFGIGSTVASANSGAYNAFNAHFNNPSTCTSCHSGTPGTVLPLGNDWKAQGGTSQTGPSTAAGWSALDAKYSAAYGGVNPSWTFTAPTVSQDLASTTGCLTSNLQLPIIFSLVFLALGLLVRRKEV